MNDRPAPDNTSGTPAWRIFICNACGLLYDERDGDPDSGLAPGTRFEDIPEDWACPLCGVSKSDFVLYQALDPKALAESRRIEHMQRSLQARPTATRLHPRATGSPGHGSSALQRGRERGLGPPHAGVVIVGAGRGGWQVAQALRERDPNVAITMLTDCSGDLYDKPLLSIAHVKKLIPETLVRERGVDAATRLQVRLMTAMHASGLSPAAHQLRTTRGTLRYSHLVLALGARPRMLAALPAALCWRINHLDAYLRMRSVLADRLQHVVIVGAGLVGCELANDLAHAGHRVTLLDPAATPLASWLPVDAATILLRAWQPLPIDFQGGAQVASVISVAAIAPHDTVLPEWSPVGGIKRVTLQNGRTIFADHVISAIGLEVDATLALGARLEWNQGIAVDQTTLATSAADVYALGDCITIGGKASRFIEPINRQAQAIAGAITGIAPAPYAERPSPLRVKTSNCGFRLEGCPRNDLVWETDAAISASGPIRMTQRLGTEIQATLTIG